MKEKASVLFCGKGEVGDKTTTMNKWIGLHRSGLRLVEVKEAVCPGGKKKEKEIRKRCDWM